MYLLPRLDWRGNLPVRSVAISPVVALIWAMAANTACVFLPSGKGEGLSQASGSVLGGICVLLLFFWA